MGQVLQGSSTCVQTALVAGHNLERPRSAAGLGSLGRTTQGRPGHLCLPIALAGDHTPHPG